jgi:hypothetical protein
VKGLIAGLNENTLKFVVTVQKETLYGHTMKVNDLNHPDYQTDSKYQLRIIAAGGVSEIDPALEVEYQAQVLAAICQDRNGFSGLDKRVLVPLDPYLAYWIVPENERRTIAWEKSVWKINPCADAELADIPHPLYYWYFWNPYQVGEDIQHRPFDCTRIFDPSLLTPLSLNESGKIIPEPGKTVGFSKSKFKASAIFGVIDPKESILNGKVFLDALQAIETKGEIPSITAGDRGSGALLGFLRKLPDVLTVETVIPNGTDQLPFRARILGTLKSSGAKLDLDLFFGHTDRLSNYPVQSNEEIIRSLESADLILYKGHSGLGENFKISTLFGGSGVPRGDETRLLRKSHQVFAFVGCHTFSYFGDDIVEARKKQKLGTTLVTTIAEGTNTNAAVNVLAWLDSNNIWQKKRARPFGDYSQIFDITNHLVIEQVH